MVARRMIRTNFISNINKKKRLEWAENYASWDEENFSFVYFSDESLLCSEKQGIKWIRK